MRGLGCVHVWVHACTLSCSVVSDSLRPYGLESARLLCPWDPPGKITGVGHYALLQGIFPAHRSEPVSLRSPTLAGRFFTMRAAWEACIHVYVYVNPRVRVCVCVSSLCMSRERDQVGSSWGNGRGCRREEGSLGSVSSLYRQDPVRINGYSRSQAPASTAPYPPPQTEKTRKIQVGLWLQALLAQANLCVASSPAANR